MTGDVLIVIDRPEFEKRLAAHLAGRPVAEQLAFLKRYGFKGDKCWSRALLLQEISSVLRLQADLAMGALAHQMLIVSTEEVV